MQYAQPPFGYGPTHYAQAYAQPLSVASIDATGHRPHIRIWFLLTALLSGLLYVAGLVVVVVGVVVDDHDLTPILVIGGYLGILLGALILYVKIGLALYWLHGAWKWVPMPERAGRDGKRFSPGDVFMLLIPYYHWYWMFPINLGLCDAMERLRLQTNASHGAKRDLAMWGAICELIPFANFFVGPFLWASYMRSIDEMHDDIMSALIAREQRT